MESEKILIMYYRLADDDNDGYNIWKTTFTNDNVNKNVNCATRKKKHTHNPQNKGVQEMKKKTKKMIISSQKKTDKNGKSH